MKNDTVSPKLFLAQQERVENLLGNGPHCLPAPISRPSGLGKARDVSAFVAPTGERVVWLHFARPDNHPDRFWSLFARGVAAWLPDFGGELAQRAFPETKRVLGRFLADLASQMQGGEPVILVFDGFDCLSGPAYRFVEGLIEARVDRLSILLLAKGWVSIQLAGAVQPAPLSDKHLRVTPEELRVYYTALGIRLPHQDLDRVLRLTDGWALAVRMLGAHLKKNATLDAKDVDAAVLNLFQALDQDMYGLLSPVARRASLLLSLLDSFSLEMATELAGLDRREALELVEAIDLMGYRPETGMYYFHQMFHQFLRRKHIHLTSEEKTAFLTAAGDWWAAAGQLREAVRCYDGADRHDRVEVLLMSMNHNYPDEALCSECLDILDRFPATYLEERPALRLVQITMLQRVGDDTRAKTRLTALLAMLEDQPKSEERRQLCGECMIMLAFYHLQQGSESYVSLMREAAGRLPGGSIVFAKRWLPFVGNRNAMVFSDCAPGELQRVRALIFAAMPYREQLLGGYAGGWEHLAAAEVEYYQGNLQEAKALACEALPRAMEGRQWDIVCGCYYYLMRIAVAGGRLEDAEAQLGRLRTYAERLSGFDRFTLADIAESGFQMKLGLPANVAHWVRDDILPPQEMASGDQSREMVIQAGYLFITRKPYEALAFVNRAVGMCGHTGQWFPKLKLLIMKALVYDELGEHVIAATVLQTAYELSHGSRIIMPYIEYGSRMRLMLTHVRALSPDVHGLPVEWLDMMEARSGTYAKRFARLRKVYFAKHQDQRNLLDSLTDREGQVLRLVCQGLTNEEVAEDLEMPVSAVTGTLKRIYPKLGAANRADAVRIAILENMANHRRAL